MSSNYNYNYSLANLNSLNPVSTPEMSDEDLARELEFLSNIQFIEVPPGVNYLDEEFQVSSAIDQKLEDQNVTQSTMLALTETQTQPTLHYPTTVFFPTSNPIGLQPITITTSNENFTSIFPATPTIVPVTVQTNVTETQENISSTSPTAKIITDTTSTTVTNKTTTKTTNTNTVTSSNSPTSGSSNRKNSSAKSNQSSNSDTTQNESAETKENEKDAEHAAKLAAEEDKRRRNTAASARFRVKKKMREQALERTAREMTAKAEMFENRVKELEMEIKWLRSLIVEKDSRLLDIERPGKKRKKDESDNNDDNNNEKEEKEEVKQEQNDQTNKKD